MLLGFWYALVGLMLMLVTLVGTRFKALPFTTAMLYLAVGGALGMAGLLRPDLFANARVLEIATEMAVLVSLFVAGMNARLPVTDRRWSTPLRLAFVAMALTVAMVAAAGVYGLGLSLGAAVLLGAVLAPTDPVLAADVQVKHPDDTDPLRFGLTGEAGLNDGVAFPFVMLGLGLLGLHDLGAMGWKWLAVDVVWAIVGGAAIGWGVCHAAAGLVLYLRAKHQKALGFDDLFSLGIVALAYGLALLFKTYGFLAVFAVGLALRRIERSRTGDASAEDLVLDIRRVGAARAAVDPRMAPAWMLFYARAFSGSLERIGEFGLLLVVGALVWRHETPWQALLFVPFLFFVVRPLAVRLSLLGATVAKPRRRLMGWLGLRGIGSVYYLAYAVVHGFNGPEAQLVGGLVFSVIAASVVVHGVTVTPLMRWYERLTGEADAAGSDASDAVEVTPPPVPSA